MKEVFIHGFKIKYEESEQAGVNYLLNDLDVNESRVFFDQARDKKYVEFEDDKEGQYTLSYNREGSYTLIRRS
ncbi:MAG: hypothetical protein A3D47_02315 [Candidatus Colwellbacteria bacterium RIFCSPHIGHO2_02_FULL_43_15]|uniref:Uncharacterized protein n=2 Tax=Candidatus Colwelliibacteriota TaxID=1817904 RepID=A0A1G1YYN7_9BACT|nr:MAG: hypothetical protein A3D47_02315 [Candidatus Colwellbacteria bacterium RIFCSPHIGHO2_02_FULL_43_15]OGY60941.1 MAG: hypothetical protein A3F99_01780 [Candidatus Colwellbacteria bacterium RIFCSPLOWO2_12_FULL_43_11]